VTDLTSQLCMKKKVLRMSLAVFLGLGILAGVVWVLTKTLGEREALYHGQPADYWSEQLTNTDATAREKATGVLTSEIIPHLTQVMFCDTNDSSLRLRLIENLNSLPGVTVYFRTADGRRAQAALCFGDFGAAARPAIPVLLQALKSNDDAVHGPAISSLGRVRSDPETIIPLLLNYLDGKELNAEAAAALGEFGTLAKGAMPKLVPLLKIPDKDLHHAVVAALQKIDPSTNAEKSGTANRN
jgi:hypothetical protein